jgi:hypothetical protein
MINECKVCGVREVEPNYFIDDICIYCHWLRFFKKGNYKLIYKGKKH